MPDELNDITAAVVDAAFRIHHQLGPGLMESVYERILARDLANRGYLVERQKPVSFRFEEMWFDDAFFADIIVDNSVVSR